jgi:hypothetical protein
MRVLLLLVFVLMFVCAGFTQTVQSVRFVVNVNSLPITISAGDVELEGLQAGTTYSTVPDGAGGLVMTPSDGIAFVSSSTETSINGDINGKILLTFVLPTQLYPLNGSVGGFVKTRFTVNSAAWGASGAEQVYFDPNIPVVINLDASGGAFVTLGGVFEVPPNATADTYVGDALVLAQYTGL